MKTLKVLLVDKNRINRTLLRSYLQCLEQDLRIHEFYSAEEAKLELSARDTDLLITDMQLPGMYGTDLIAYSKGINEGQKNVLLCHRLSPDIRHLANEVSVDALLNKPIDKAEFLDSVERLLGMVTSVLPSEFLVNNKSSKETKNSYGLNEKISKVRNNSDSSAIFILNDLGEIIIRDGELPNNNIEDEIIDEVIKKFQDNTKNLHGPSLTPPLVFKKNHFEIHFSPLGESCIFLNIFETTDTKLTKSNYIETQKTVLTLLDYLSLVGVRIDKQHTASKPLVFSKEERNLFDYELANWFQNNPIHKKDADIFWKNNGQKETFLAKNIINLLSYQQAFDLGLAPANIGAD